MGILCLTGGIINIISITTIIRIIIITIIIITSIATNIVIVRSIVAGSLEAAYSLNWGAREIWGKCGGETLALLW